MAMIIAFGLDYPYPSPLWTILVCLWLALFIGARGTAELRLAKITSAACGQNVGRPGRLSKENRKKFFLSAWVYMPLGYLIGISGVLFLVNLISSLTIGFGLFLSVICILFYAAGLMHYYVKLRRE